MGDVLMRLVFLIGFLTSTCFGLQCYRCFDKSKVCTYGKTNYLGTLNCSDPDDVCVTFQYETDDSDRAYITTIRGCNTLPKEGMCNLLMKTVYSKAAKKTVKRGVFCETCDTDLCNSCLNFGGMLLLIMLTPILIHMIK